MLDRFWRYFEFQLNHLGVCFPNMFAHTFMGILRSCTKRCSPCAGDDHSPMFAWVVGLHESSKQMCHSMSSNCGLWTGFFLTRSSQDEIFVTRGLLDYSASGTLPLGPCGSQAVGGVYFGMSLSELFGHGKAWYVADLFCCTCGWLPSRVP